MSIENAILEHAAAIRALAAAMTGASTDTPAETVKAAKGGTKAPKPAGDPDPAATGAQAATPAASPAGAATAPTGGPTLAQVQDSVKGLAAAAGANQARALLAKFGVQKASELPAEKFADFIKEAEFNTAADAASKLAG